MPLFRVKLALAHLNLDPDDEYANGDAALLGLGLKLISIGFPAVTAILHPLLYFDPGEYYRAYQEAIAGLLEVQRPVEALVYVRRVRV